MKAPDERATPNFSAHSTFICKISGLDVINLGVLCIIRRICRADKLHSCRRKDRLGTAEFSVLIERRARFPFTASNKSSTEPRITEPHIRVAACRDPRFLCHHVEKCLKPRISELKEIGFSPSEISLLFSICPSAFSYTKLKQKVQFWMGIFGSVEKLLCAFKVGNYLLGANLDNAVIPNITFLQEQCGLSACQISQLIKSSPRRITSKPEVFKMYVKRAKELGISPPSNTLVYALIVVGGLKQSTVYARLCHLKSLGLSHEEVTLLITKCPSVLEKTEKNLGQKMEFLLKQAGCGKIDVIQNPSLLTCSLEKRLIPRGLVRKLLKSRGIPVANNVFASFMVLNEKRFLEKYVLPYEGTIPGLHQAYIDACAGKTAAT